MGITATLKSFFSGSKENSTKKGVDPSSISENSVQDWGANQISQDAKAAAMQAVSSVQPEMKKMEISGPTLTGAQITNPVLQKVANQTIQNNQGSSR